MKTAKKATKTATTTTAPARIKAALYLRMSDKQQDMSIDQQRAELEPWAEREGYEIVTEYIDSGKSGSKATHKRVAFLKMVADAPDAEWVAIITYDVSRFGRLDSIKGSKYVEPLMDAKKYLHAKVEGKYDWRTTEGRTIWAMLCEQAHKTSLTISSSSIRGRQHVASIGCWAAGKVPFGYDKVYSYDKQTITVKRADRFQKGRGWRLRLIESPTEAPTLKTIFKRFTDTEVSLRQLAADLHTEGHPSGGKTWTGQLLKNILTDSTYIGTKHFGDRSHAVEKHNSVTTQERPNDAAAPALIKAKTFAAAQLKLSRREKDNSKPKTATAGLLSGFLVCDGCGKRMGKKTAHGRVTYRCEIAGKQKAGKCKQWAVREDQLLPDILAYLLRNVGRELVELSSRPDRPKQPKGIADIIRPRVEELRARVKLGTDNALLAPNSNAAKVAWERVSQWSEELAEAERQLAAVGAVAVDYVKYWADIVAQLRQCVSIEFRDQDKKATAPGELDLWALRFYGADMNPNDIRDTELIVAEPAKLRGLFDRLQLLVRLTFKHEPRPTGRRGRIPQYVLVNRLIGIRLQPLQPLLPNCEDVAIRTTTACPARSAPTASTTRRRG